MSNALPQLTDDSPLLCESCNQPTDDLVCDVCWKKQEERRVYPEEPDDGCYACGRDCKEVH